MSFADRIEDRQMTITRCLLSNVVTVMGQLSDGVDIVGPVI